MDFLLRKMIGIEVCVILNVDIDAIMENVMVEIEERSDAS